MIKKVNKLKNLGLFSNYNWDPKLPQFKRFNLIYGYNGSGKTTFTNLFNALEIGSLEEYPRLEYELYTEKGLITEKSLFHRKVRVFNQNYISKNIQLSEAKAGPIYILGEDNKDLLDEIQADEKTAGLMENNCRQEKAAHEKQQKEKDKKFTDIAKTITLNARGLLTRNYRKTNAENRFNALESKQLITDEELDVSILTLNQQEKFVISELKCPKIESSKGLKDVVDAFESFLLEGKQLFAQTVEVVVIERLKQFSNISKWVEEGLVLYHEHKPVVCEFCTQVFPVNRIAQLTAYFNDADKKLKTDIDNLVNCLRNVYSAVSQLKVVDKLNFYEEIQKEYQIEAELFEKEKELLLEKIKELGEKLKVKNNNTTESITLNYEISWDAFNKSIHKINNLIIKNNTKTNNFINEKKIAQERLEKHYLSTIYDEVKLLEQELKSKSSSIAQLDEAIKKIKHKIMINKAKISPSQKACEEINDKLATFLGRRELTFEVEGMGYLIKRKGLIPKSLSEGEKTAIAFTYFVVHLRDQSFNVEEGILVIDDPISSLDSNSIFQTFAFLKSAVKEAKQIFIFTHNFDFLRLLINWLKYKDSENSCYFMIKNFLKNDNREAFLTQMDKELRYHETEYHFLFKILYNFISDGTIAQAYNIPNIARKVLDTFLMFRVPNRDNQFKKIQALEEHFDNNKLHAIYKFTNDLSHITGQGFNPALVLETEKNVKYLLEMMKTVFPEHYQILEESIKN